MELNMRGIENVLEVARENELRLFAPSSIAAFGPSTPAVNTPDEVVMRPTTIYGVSKVSFTPSLCPLIALHCFSLTWTSICSY